MVTPLGVSIDKDSFVHARKNLLKASEDLQKKLREQVARSALTVVSQAKLNASSKKAVDTGLMRKSIHARFPTEENGFVAEVATVGTGYARHVEDGTGLAAGHGPYRAPPPVRALIPWVRRHVGILGIKGKRKGDAILSAAFALSRVIFKRGIKPRPFLVPAWEEERPRFLSAVKKIISEVGKTPGRGG